MGDTTNSRTLLVYGDFPIGDCECQRHEESGVEISIAYNTRGYPGAFSVAIQKPVLKYFCMRGGDQIIDIFLIYSNESSHVSSKIIKPSRICVVLPTVHRIMPHTLPEIVTSLDTILAHIQ